MLDFDQYIYKEFIVPILKSNEEKPKREKVSPAYTAARRKVATAKKELEKAKRNAKIKTKEITTLRKKIKQFANERNKTPYAKIESLPKGSVYVRYADDWVLALTCTKKTATEIKQKISEYLKEKKKMELDMEKTKISFVSTGYKFLGFEIRMGIAKPKQMRVLQLDKKTGIYSRVLKRTTSRQITVEPDSERILKRLKRLKMCKNNYDPVAKPTWIIYDEFEIVQKYAQIFRGLFNYYEPCARLSRLNYVSYILQYSCARTLARRKKVSLKEVFQLYGKNLIIKKTILGTKKESVRTIKFQDLTTLKKQSEQKSKKKIYVVEYQDPFRIQEHWRTKFKMYNECCICGSEGPIALHHINSLRSINSKNQKDRYENIRSQINRLQIPVCTPCHHKITQGEYNNLKTPIEFFNEFLAKL